MNVKKTNKAPLFSSKHTEPRRLFRDIAERRQHTWMISYINTAVAMVRSVDDLGRVFE